MNSEATRNGAAREVSDEELRQELIAELDELTERLKALTPEYEPPSFSSQRLVDLLGKRGDGFSDGKRLIVRPEGYGPLAEN